MSSLGSPGALFTTRTFIGGGVSGPPWLQPDPPGNLIDYPNGRMYLDTPPGDWTFVVTGAEYPNAWDLNNQTAPNGNVEAWRYIEGNPGAGSTVWNAWVTKTKSSGTAPETYTGSIYAKRGPGNDRNVGLVIQSPHNGDNYAEVMFDLSTGATSLSGDLDSTTLLDFGCVDAGSGWWWCQMAATVAEVNSEVSFAWYSALTSGATFTDRVVYTANSTSGLYFWRGRLAEGNTIYTG